VDHFCGRAGSVAGGRKEESETVKRGRGHRPGYPTAQSNQRALRSQGLSLKIRDSNSCTSTSAGILHRTRGPGGMRPPPGVPPGGRACRQEGHERATARRGRRGASSRPRCGGSRARGRGDRCGACGVSRLRMECGDECHGQRDAKFLRLSKAMPRGGRTGAGTACRPAPDRVNQHHLGVSSRWPPWHILCSPIHHFHRLTRWEETPS
jgi:hypothetical protein